MVVAAVAVVVAAVVVWAWGLRRVKY